MFEVAPEILLKVFPASVLTCHWTVGGGLPLAVALNVTFCPNETLWLVGLFVIVGVVNNVSVAGVVVTWPCEFVKTASYSLPFCAAVATKL